MRADIFTRQVSENTSGFKLALFCSLVLHAGVFGFAYRFSFAPDNAGEATEEIHDEVIGIEVYFSTVNPQLPEPPAADSESGVMPEDIQGASTVVNSQAAEEASVTLDDPVAEQAVTAGLDETLIRLPETVTEAGSGMEGDQLSAARLQSSLATFLQDYRQDLNQNWVEECARYKKQFAVKDCPYGGNYAASLNPVRLQTVVETPPPALAPGEFSAQESFRLMTQTDLFNPHMLSGNIPLFGMGGGGILNAGAKLINMSLGLTRPHAELLIRVQEVESDAPEDDAAKQEDREGSGFFIRPPLF